MSTETNERQGTLVRKWEFAGKGAALQLLALLAPVIGTVLLGGIGLVLGLIALVVLFVIGSNKSKVWICSECRNRVADGSVRVCPTCRADFR